MEFEIELAYVQNEVKKIEKQREAKDASRKSGGDWRIHAKKAAKVCDNQAKRVLNLIGLPLKH